MQIIKEFFCSLAMAIFLFAAMVYMLDPSVEEGLNNFLDSCMTTCGGEKIQSQKNDELAKKVLEFGGPGF